MPSLKLIPNGPASALSAQEFCFQKNPASLAYRHPQRNDSKQALLARNDGRTEIQATTNKQTTPRNSPTAWPSELRLSSDCDPFGSKRPLSSLSFGNP